MSSVQLFGIGGIEPGWRVFSHLPCAGTGPNGDVPFPLMFFCTLPTMSSFDSCAVSSSSAPYVSMILFISCRSGYEKQRQSFFRSDVEVDDCDNLGL